MPQTTADNLADRLRVATAAAHRTVERAGFIQVLLRGQAARADYVHMLAALLPIYTALEAGLDRHHDHPWLAWIDRETLRRVPALTRDLAHLSAAPPSPPPAARAYAEHLEHLTDQAPALLVAHAYTRYLGDLAGGQAIRRVVARSYGLSDAGLEFYAFTGDLDELRRKFRAGLAALPIDTTITAAIVEEARHAFDLHARLFAELG